MARIRTIKPEFFTSEAIASLPLAARLTFIGLWTHADDYGRLVDNPRIIKGAIWPLDDDVTPTDVSLHIHMLVDLGLLARYEAEGRRYLHVCNWEEHQKMNRKAAAKHPAPPESTGTQCDSSAPAVRTQRKVAQEQGTGNRESLSSDCTAHALHAPTTQTEEERGIDALKILGTRLARSANKPDGYALTVVKNAIQLPELVTLARNNPAETADQLVDRYQAAQTNGHSTDPQPKRECTRCHAISHTIDNCPLKDHT